MEVRLIKIDKDPMMHAVDSGALRKTVCGIDLKKVKYHKDAMAEYLELYRDITCPKCSAVLTKRSLKEGRNDIYKEANKIRLERGPKLVQLSELYNEDGTKKGASLFGKKKKASGNSQTNKESAADMENNSHDDFVPGDSGDVQDISLQDNTIPSENGALHFKEYKPQEQKKAAVKYDLTGLAPKPKAYEETIGKQIESGDLPPAAVIKVDGNSMQGAADSADLNNNNNKPPKLTTPTPPVTPDDLSGVLAKINTKKVKPKKEFTEVLDIKVPQPVVVKDNEWNQLVNSLFSSIR